jgi:hypothetical protein
MEKATIIGIDLAKRVFQVHAASKDGRYCARRCRGRSCSASWLNSRHGGDGSVRDGARLGTGDQRSRARRAARSTNLRQAVCAPPEERRRRRRGGLKADDALCGVEDGRAASAIHDLSDPRPAGAAANPVGQRTARPSGGAWDCRRSWACPGESAGDCDARHGLTPSARART